MTHQPRLIPDEPTAQSMDDAQKAAYRERLRQKLQDAEFRQIEGFPLGEDEDILALSDPPYYTACPNPFLPEIIAQWQAERTELRQKLGLPDDDPNNGYHREPFAADVSEGKNDPIYNAHSYHTKVPHKAIMRYILHYTDPGDIVLDGFCGTGMTGVAAQLCGNIRDVESLGYYVDPQRIVHEQGEEKGFSHIGSRRVILSDLAPAAAHIAYNYNYPGNKNLLEKDAKRILKEVESEVKWMYETWHPHCDDKARVKAIIRHVVWSDVFICPECGAELIFWDEAVDKIKGAVRDLITCPECNAQNAKRNLERSWITFYDSAIGQVIQQAKRTPVIINYVSGKQRLEKIPDREDLDLIRRIEENDIDYWIPSNSMAKGDKTSDPNNVGITHAHHFYTKRNLYVLAALWKRIRDHHNKQLLFWFTSTLAWCGRENRLHLGNYFKKTGGVITSLRGTWYIASLSIETNVLYRFGLRIKSSQFKGDFQSDSVLIQSQSSTDLKLCPAETIDYIFVDPPFGANLMYSELNFTWEAWLRNQTNRQHEAIVNKTQKKALSDYQSLMEKCFKQFYDVLKPGRWMTVEFHNSQNSVWNSIQEAILRAGFVVADVRALAKGKGSFNQVTATGAVKQDLIISAYKPHSGFEQYFLQEAGTEKGAWDFVSQHLTQLPIVVQEKGVIETLSERQDYLLFDRMVAFHIQRGASVPLSASQFYAGLRERFVERDGMFFLAEQVPEYDRARLQAQSVAQLTLFVTDEKSSIQWLRQQLAPDFGGHPQTYQDIQPKFLRQLHQLKHEALPELSDILEQNFLQDERGRWYVPDPNKASDLEKLRQKALLREFDSYLADKRRLRQFRTEAVRAGFAHAWNQKEYATIVQVAERLPESVLQEDPDLLMYYDNASLLTG